MRFEIRITKPLKNDPLYTTTYRYEQYRTTAELRKRLTQLTENGVLTENIKINEYR